MKNNCDTHYGDYGMLPSISKTLKCIDGYLNRRLKEEGIGLSRKQFIILKILKQNGPLPQHDLAFVSNRDKASLTRFINTLEKKNLLARIPSVSDKRINLIHLTKHGETIFEKTVPIFKRLISEMQSNIPEADQVTTIQLLSKIQDNIKFLNIRCSDNQPV